MAFLLLLVTALLLAMLKAKVATLMWGWFLVPLGLPAVPFGLALGYVYLFDLLRGPSWEDLKEHDAEAIIKMVIICAFHVIFILVIGWLVHMAIGTG